MVSRSRVYSTVAFFLVCYGFCCCSLLWSIWLHFWGHG